MRLVLFLMACVPLTLGIGLGVAYLTDPARPTTEAPKTAAPPTAAGPAAAAPVDEATLEKQRRYIHRAATLIIQLEEQDPEMGGPHFKRRYEELLRTEEPLRKEYEALKKERAEQRGAKGT